MCANTFVSGFCVLFCFIFPLGTMGQVPDLSSKSRTQGDRACEIQVQRRLKLMTSEKRISTLSGWVLMWIIWCRTGGGDSPAASHTWAATVV